MTQPIVGTRPATGLEPPSRPTKDWSGDLVLNALQGLDDPVGSLVRAFPGRTAAISDPDWLNEWFLALTTQILEGAAPDPSQIIASAADRGVVSLLARPPVTASVKLVSLRPEYFRGFRKLGSAIRLDADLLVVEGRNSSGKTSISEAIEWVLTGQLSRRTSGQLGHPSELARCIANEFRPTGEDTSVEIVLEVDGTSKAIKRILDHDYSSTAAEACASHVLVNGTPLSLDEERALLEVLFGGVHPILMQHNLRQFVHDDPSQRREYFERLLQIDELTALIEKAAIGPAALKTFDNPQGGAARGVLDALTSELTASGVEGSRDAMSDFKRIERAGASESALETWMTTVGRLISSVEDAGSQDLGALRARFNVLQQAQRESRLPLLTSLISAREHLVPEDAPLVSRLDELFRARESLGVAEDRAAAVSIVDRELGQAVDRLVEQGLLDPEVAVQTCPLCGTSPAGLAQDRLQHLRECTPLAAALELASRRTADVAASCGRDIGELQRSLQAILPAQQQAAAVEPQLATLPETASALASRAMASGDDLRPIVSQLARVLAELQTSVNDARIGKNDIHDQLLRYQSLLTDLRIGVAAHRRDVERLEAAVGVAEHADPSYRLREKWLSVAGQLSSVAGDLRWDAAKSDAKERLDVLRKGLIALRTRLIEDVQRAFSEEMTSVWRLLRRDTGARFSGLHVPEARGRGYKLEFELKAHISDGNSEVEVDALRVFSESQVNVVGIAAYVTRAKRLGHRLLIFDDPVQSMDEEHFRSFAADLLPSLIEAGHQVVILTHSETFARRIDDANYTRLSYATLSTRQSRRKGCCVDEGNRRVAERLDKAEAYAADGQLELAWRTVRLAIERLYTLVYHSAHTKFDPESWRNTTAEDMWEKGVQEIVNTRAPGAAPRLREILTATAPGAHDKSAPSETDLRAACSELRRLLAPLRVGAG